jgi:tetratricopeptide (TPR) repeat protein
MKEQPVLESWKEISGYLKRSVKTCQRWEIELDLPIHRLDGTPSARVFAYPDELDRWSKEKQSHRDVKAPKPFLVLRLKKKWVALAAGAFFGLAGSVGLVWHFFIRQPIAFPSGNLPGVAFLPFENVTGDETLESWRTALPHLLYIEFLQSMTVGVSDTWSGLKKLEMLEAKKYSAGDIRKIAESVGGEYIATGSFINSGQEIIVNLYLHDNKTGEVIQSFRAICRNERAIFDEVDKLTKKIKLALNIPRRLISVDIDEDVSQIVTGSPEALKLYCQGLRLDREGKVDEAIPLYKKAIEIDPEFAEAFYMLFVANQALFLCCETAGAKEEAIRAGEKAFEFSDRLNIWSRGVLVGDYYLNFQKNLDMAIVEYKKLLPLTGHDPTTALQLAQIYYDLEEYENIIALLDNERMKRDPRNIKLLANSYVRIGEYTKAEKTFDDYISRPAARSGSLLFDREVCALNQKKFEEAFFCNDRLLSGGRPPSVERSRAPIFIAQDDFANAERELHEVVEQGNGSEKFRAFISLAGLCLTQGKLDEGRELAEAALASASGLQDWIAMKRAHLLRSRLEGLCGNWLEALQEAELACPCYQEDDLIVDEEKKSRIVSKIDDIYCLRYFHQRALLGLEMGRMEDFDKQVAEVKQVIDEGQHPRLIRIYYHLLGRRELMKGNYDAAVNYFWKALNRLPSPYGHEADIDTAQYYGSLAEAYYQAGKGWSALDLYKKIPAYWEQKLNSGDIYARSFYRVAKIYDQIPRPPGTSDVQLKADKTMAIENYRKFLNLWKDADPFCAPEVEDARVRLAALEAE